MQTMGRVRLGRPMALRFVRQLDIGRKAQIAPLSSVDVLTWPAIFRRYSRRWRVSQTQPSLAEDVVR